MSTRKRKYEMPPPIPDTPENIARACIQGPPKKEWDFLKKERADKDSVEENQDD